MRTYSKESKDKTSIKLVVLNAEKKVGDGSIVMAASLITLLKGGTNTVRVDLAFACFSYYAC